MAQVASLLVRLQADIDDYQRKMKEATDGIKKFQTQMKGTSNILSTISDRLKNFGKSMTKYVTVPLVGLGTVATRAAMTYETSLNQVNNTLGESSKIIHRFVEDNATAFNMSKKEAMKYGAVYSNILSSFVSEQEDNARLTESLLRQSAVVASWTGRSMEDVMERINSGLLGSTEAIEKLGINVNVAMLESTEAFKKFANGKSWNQLSFQQQQAIRLFSILEQSVERFGTELNTTRFDSLTKLRVQLENIATALGETLIPIISDFIDNYIMPVIDRFKEMDEQTRKNVVMFLLMGAAIGPLVIGIAGLIGMVVALSIAFAFLAANPVVLAISAIIIVIAVLIGIMIYLYNTNEKVRNAFQNLWSNLKEFFGQLAPFFHAAAETFVGTLRNWWDSIVTTATSVINIFAEVFGFLGALLRGDWEDMTNHAKEIWKNFAGSAVVTAANLVDDVLSIFQKLTEILPENIFNKVVEKYQDMMNDLVKGYNWLAGKLGWKQLKPLSLDGVTKDKTLDAFQAARDKWEQIAEKYRGGEKTKLPWEGWGANGGYDKPKGPPLDDTLDIGISPITINDYNSLKNLFEDIGETAELSADGIEKLADSVRNLVQSMRQQADSFRDALGMFDKFEREVTSPERLMNRMKAQVKAMKQWTSALATLHNRGVDEQFLNQLRSMGPQSVDYVMAIAKMSDSQLAQYQSMYGQKYDIAQREAERMVVSQQKIDKYVEQEIQIQISNSKISSEDDVDRIAKQIVRKLKLKGV